MEKREIGFTVDRQGGVMPRVPQYGGMRGEHNHSEVVFTLFDGMFQAETDVLRIAFCTGDGAVVSSDLLTIGKEIAVGESGCVAVRYPLHRLLTACAGQLSARLICSSLDENGCEAVMWTSQNAVLYFDDAELENGTPFWTGVSEMLKGTADNMHGALGAAQEAQEAAKSAQAQAEQALCAEKAAAEQADRGANEADRAANEADRAANEADRAAASAEETTYCKAKAAEAAALAEQNEAAARSAADCAVSAADAAASVIKNAYTKEESEARLAEKLDAAAVTDTASSTNPAPISSRGMCSYVQAGLRNKQGVLTFDAAPTAGSENPVTSGGIAAALEGVVSPDGNMLYKGQITGPVLIGKTDMTLGDVWFVLNDKRYYIWTGEKWNTLTGDIPIASTVNQSGTQAVSGAAVYSFVKEQIEARDAEAMVLLGEDEEVSV